jgi:hypothetical protein
MMALFWWPRFVRKSPTWSSFSAMPNKPVQSGNKRTSHFKNISLELTTLYYRLHR